MGRYFFNLRYGTDPGRIAIDPEGSVLPDAAAARAYALQAARDLIRRGRSDAVRDWFACAFDIVDAAGRPVLTVPFSETIPDAAEE
ncbi:DUF6894 family protein [Methylobacterium sp. PvR107]|uniref:DUF6894 family protein n=1 Tax=Methylobacterium sp. PvR107 TaxID=2806597 RepID=UPI001AE3ECE2|nr:hypothetical protein [Methylobacterium sp. PvR107]MBP1181374.1 hypothetical protein [Methylobacterium sp. PvR107]